MIENIPIKTINKIKSILKRVLKLLKKVSTNRNPVKIIIEQLGEIVKI
jgi:hypothetical protein